MSQHHVDFCFEMAHTIYIVDNKLRHIQPDLIRLLFSFLCSCHRVIFGPVPFCIKMIQKLKNPCNQVCVHLPRRSVHVGICSLHASRIGAVPNTFRGGAAQAGGMQPPSSNS